MSTASTLIPPVDVERGNVAPSSATSKIPASLEDVLGYQFEPLIHRMIDKYGWEESVARAVYADTLRFLWLCGMKIGHFSPITTVDEVWHNFILFTDDYTKFCNEHFGFYIHHRPNRRDEKQDPKATERMRAIVIEHFGEEGSRAIIKDSWDCTPCSDCK